MTFPRRGSIGLRVTLLAAAASALLLGTPAGTLAAGPSHFSAGDQYVETIPSAEGPKATHGKREGNRGKGAALPPELRQKLLAQGGPEAERLLEIATSPQLGAPEQTHKRSAGARERSEQGVPAAAIDAVGGGQSGLGWLVLALIVITALALGALGYQRYKDKGSAG
jgi:hypothetical protein